MKKGIMAIVMASLMIATVFGAMSVGASFTKQKENTSSSVGSNLNPYATATVTGFVQNRYGKPLYTSIGHVDVDAYVDEGCIGTVPVTDKNGHFELILEDIDLPIDVTIKASVQVWIPAHVCWSNPIPLSITEPTTYDIGIIKVPVPEPRSRDMQSLGLSSLLHRFPILSHLLGL